jgi:hypothetical protein
MTDVLEIHVLSSVKRAVAVLDVRCVSFLRQCGVRVHSRRRRMQAVCCRGQCSALNRNQTVSTTVVPHSADQRNRKPSMLCLLDANDSDTWSVSASAQPPRGGQDGRRLACRGSSAGTVLSCAIGFITRPGLSASRLVHEMSSMAWRRSRQPLVQLQER